MGNIETGRGLIIAACIIGMVWVMHPPRVVVYGDTIINRLPKQPKSEKSE